MDDARHRIQDDLRGLIAGEIETLNDEWASNAEYDSAVDALADLDAILDGRGLIERIMNHCTEPRFVYEHVWRAGDLVMWDNGATVHRGTEYDTAAEPRLVRRTVVRGETPVAG